MKRIPCLFVLCFATLTQGQVVSTARKPIIPLQPLEVIKLLPAPPNGWELKESKAKSFYNEWLVSQGTRQLLQKLPPVTSPSAASTPAQPPTTRLQLTDTGYSPSLFGDFNGFAPGKSGSSESLTVAGFPARRMIFSGGERLRILVKGRFVIEIETHGQTAEASAAWVRQFDFNRLVSIPEAGIETLPNPVTVVSLDELDPKANGSYQVNWSTQADLDSARKRRP